MSHGIPNCSPHALFTVGNARGARERSVLRTSYHQSPIIRRTMGIEVGHWLLMTVFAMFDFSRRLMQLYTCMLDLISRELPLTVRVHILMVIAAAENFEEGNTCVWNSARGSDPRDDCTSVTPI